MFKKFSLKIKMILSFMSIASLLLLQGFLSNRTNAEVSSYFYQVVDVTLENLRGLSDFADVTSEAHLAVLSAGLASDPEVASKQLAKVKSFEEKFAAVEAVYSKIEFYPGEKEVYDKFITSWKNWDDIARKASEMFFSAKNASDLDRFKDYLSKDLYAAHEEIEKNLIALAEFQQNHAKNVKDKGQQAVKLGSTLGFLMIGFGILLACAIGFIFSTVLSKQLRAITEQIHESASNTTSASNQLTGASKQLSSGSTSSASSLEETVASLEELSSMVKTNSDHAKEANALSQKSKDSAEHGEKEIAKLIGSMSTIAAGSKKIEDIINVIDDIAFQTNLLALNAAVEAARAGEQGKGFAVVAEAVRNLAQRSAIAAKDIAGLIKENVTRSVEGAKVAETSGVVLTDIVTNVKKVSDLNNEIASASQEQSQGIEQISSAMNQLDRLTQENAASAEQLNASSEVLQTQSAQFVELVTALRVLVDGEGYAYKKPEVKKVSNEKSDSSKGMMSWFNKMKAKSAGAKPAASDKAKTKEVSKPAKSALPDKKSEVAIAKKTVDVKPAEKTQSNVIPMESKSGAKKRTMELESILPLEETDSDRKVGGTEGF